MEEEEEYIGEDTIIELEDDYNSVDPDDFVWHPAAADGPLSVDYIYQGLNRLRKNFSCLQQDKRAYSYKVGR